MRCSWIVIFAFSIGACSNTVSSLHYVPSVPVQTVSLPRIGGVTATDQRKEAPNRLATIIGGFGNPLKTLDTTKPVKDEVVSAFTDGLSARGLLACGGKAPFQIVLVVRKFDADMIIGRTARIDLSMSVIDTGSDTVFQDSAIDSQSDLRFFQTGVFADIADLQTLSQVVLDRTVDRMLDNPSFRAVLVSSQDTGR